jgi:hypothetical protein
MVPGGPLTNPKAVIKRWVDDNIRPECAKTLRLNRVHAGIYFFPVPIASPISPHKKGPQDEILGTISAGIS